MDKLRDMETFVSVVEAGSFARAAERAGVSPVMIGRRISLIEQRLGGTLLERSTRRLTLTTAGEEYHRHATSMLARLGTAEQLVSTGRDYATGQLVVSCPSSFGRHHVAPHLRGFMRANPDVHVSLNLTDRLVDLIRLGYTLGIRSGPVSDSNLAVARLAPSRMVVCATPEYLERHGTPLAPEDIAPHNCLTYNEHGGQPRGWQFQKDSHSILLRPSGSLASNDGAMLTQWVLEGRGLAWRPHWEIAGALSDGRLVSVLDDFAAPGHDIVAVYPPQNPLPAKIRLLVAWLREVYGRPEYWQAPREARP